jgi:anti-anti-sigma factor
VSQQEQPFPDFGMAIEHRGPTVVIRLDGELDRNVSREFERRMRDVYSIAAEQLVIDLRKVLFVDSTGLSLLLSVWKESQRVGFELILVRAPEKVRRLFETTRIAPVLPLRDEMPELPS